MADVIAHLVAIMALLVVSLGGIFIERQMPRALKATRSLKNRRSTTGRHRAGNGESVTDRSD